MAFEFYPCEIEYWSGRYGRIVGSGTSFHIRDCDGELWFMLDWRTDDETARCLATEKGLIEITNRLKSANESEMTYLP